MLSIREERSRGNMSIEEMIRGIVKDEFRKLELEVQEKVFNTSEAAQYLRVSKDWLYKNLNYIPHTDVGGYKFLKSDLDSWIKDKTGLRGKVSISQIKIKGSEFRV